LFPILCAIPGAWRSRTNEMAENPKVLPSNPLGRLDSPPTHVAAGL